MVDESQNCQQQKHVANSNGVRNSSERRQSGDVLRVRAGADCRAEQQGDQGVRTSAIEQLLTPKHLARRWHLSPRSIERWRSEGRGPSFVRLLGRVLYRLEDVERYEREHLCQPEAPR